ERTCGRTFASARAYSSTPVRPRKVSVPTSGFRRGLDPLSFDELVRLGFDDVVGREAAIANLAIQTLARFVVVEANLAREAALLRRMRLGRVLVPFPNAHV